MNPALFKCLCVFSLFAIIGFGPISPGCLIGMYVVTTRPDWFIKLVRELYSDQGKLRFPLPNPPFNSLLTRQRCFLSLLGLFILDIAPVPVTPVVAFIILLSRPRWFYEMVEKIYAH